VAYGGSGRHDRDRLCAGAIGSLSPSTWMSLRRWLSRSRKAHKMLPGLANQGETFKAGDGTASVTQRRAAAATSAWVASNRGVKARRSQRVYARATGGDHHRWLGCDTTVSFHRYRTRDVPNATVKTRETISANAPSPWYHGQALGNTRTYGRPPAGWAPPPGHETRWQLVCGDWR